MQPTRREDRTNSILLVIEQNAATRSGMKRLLEMNGYAVTAVADEREAAFVAQQKSYDFILHDSNLPPPESFAAAYELRQRAELRDTPLLVISVHEKFNVSLNQPDADKFTVAFMTDLSRFDELEKLIGCLTM
ncbi:MAG: response regulator [Acidobacteria bacterium]|jgi:CheY-like chemotaxis protein|nr:response regulator [Acidobacteriota bacterium]